MARTHGSFRAFQEEVRQLLNNSPSIAQLDGQLTKKKNPVTTDEVTLSELPGLEMVVIAFHGDTTRDALERVARGSINDFVVLAPRPGAKEWRFHSAATHNLQDLDAADGMFTHVKH